MATEVEIEKLQRDDHDRLVRLEGKIDTFILMQTATSTEVADHEQRLRVAETNYTDLNGTIRGLRWALGAVFAIAGLIEPLILFFVSRPWR